MFGFNSLEGLCEALHIPQVNCTCEAMGIIASEGTPDFCKLIVESGNERNKTIWLPLVITVVAIFALIGNIIVVLVKMRKVVKKSRYTCLIIFLALCDIFFAIFILIYYVPMFSTNRWIYGSIGCKIISGAITLGAWVAIGVILIIAIERFMGIVYPFRRGITNKWMYSLLVINVVVAICCVIPRIIHLRLHPEIFVCHENWVEHVMYLKTYDWLVFVLFTVLPLIVISLLYFMIFRSLTKSSFKCQDGGSQYMNRVYADRLRSNKRSMILLVNVLVAFVLCTFPNKIKWLVESFISSSDISIINIIENPYFTTITEVMYPIHLAINPIIYTAADKAFRKAVKSGVCFLCGRHKTTISSSGTEATQVYSTNIHMRPFSQRTTTG